MIDLYVGTSRFHQSFWNQIRKLQTWSAMRKWRLVLMWGTLFFPVLVLLCPRLFLISFAAIAGWLLSIVEKHFYAGIPCLQNDLTLDFTDTVEGALLFSLKERSLLHNLLVYCQDHVHCMVIFNKISVRWDYFLLHFPHVTSCRTFPTLTRKLFNFLPTRV